MKKSIFIIPLLMVFKVNAGVELEVVDTDVSTTKKPLGCIVSVDTGEEYCLSAGESSGKSLPDWIIGKEIYVNAAPGTKVLLSDVDDLAYDRVAGFVGTVRSYHLDVEAWNGLKINFNHPRSMRVISDGEPLGCIVSVETGKQFCLPAGKKAGYSLPPWIYGEKVYVNAAPGTKVLLSSLDNLSYNYVADFIGTVKSWKLENVAGWNGEVGDYSRPHSMRVESSDVPLGCITTIESGQSFCLPAGEDAGYSLPEWINGKEVYVTAPPGIQVNLSDWDNLSYNRYTGFTGGTIAPNELKGKVWDDTLEINVSHPRSMGVWAVSTESK